MKLALVLLLAGGEILAQGWDTSGNGMLNGAYRFRQVYYGVSDKYGDLNSQGNFYGNITFDGNGNYTIDGFYYDTGIVHVSGAVTVSGTYSIAASGYGFIVAPCFQTPPYQVTCPTTPSPIYGLVSAHGIFVGSYTENGANNMMVAAPAASPAPTASSFTGSWTCAAFDISSGIPNYALSFLFTLNPDGNGNLNAGNISGYEGSNSAPITQDLSGLTYSFSSGVATATFPAGATLPVGSSLIGGQKSFYFSADGNLLFGGSLQSSDMIVGVKTSAGMPTLSGLYAQVGLDEAGGNLDTWFGSFYVTGAAPQTILGHRRSSNGITNATTENTYSQSITLAGNSFSNTSANYIVGGGGEVAIASGIAPNLGIGLAVQVPTPAAGAGVFVNPAGVVNAASNAPFTARIAPGELLTLYGTNLATSTVTAGIPFPTGGLDGVHVTIGGLPAAIYYVSPSQISAIVPYGVAVGSVASIQVTNSMGASNIVTNYVSATAPGVFTQNQQGTGYGDIEHLGIGNSVAAAGSVVSDSNPAIPGETLAVYLTGLGAVSPAIGDGAAGPSGILSRTTNTIGVAFSGIAGTNGFAGLAPGYSGLYQLNLTVPAGVTAGPNYLALSGPDSSMSYLLIPVGAPAVPQAIR